MLSTRPTNQTGNPLLAGIIGGIGSTQQTHLQADGSTLSERVNPRAKKPTTKAIAPTQLVSESMANFSPKELEVQDGRQVTILRPIQPDKFLQAIYIYMCVCVQQSYLCVHVYVYTHVNLHIYRCTLSMCIYLEGWRMPQLSSLDQKAATLDCHLNGCTGAKTKEYHRCPTPNRDSPIGIYEATHFRTCGYFLPEKKSLCLARKSFLYGHKGYGSKIGPATGFESSNNDTCHRISKHIGYVPMSQVPLRIPQMREQKMVHTTDTNIDKA